eukprot:491458_1
MKLVFLLPLFATINAKYFNNKQEAETFGKTIISRMNMDYFNAVEANKDDWVWNQFTEDALFCVQEKICAKGKDAIWSTWSPLIGMVKNCDSTTYMDSYSDNGIEAEGVVDNTLFDGTKCIGTCRFLYYANDDGKATQFHIFCKPEWWDCFEKGTIKYLESKQISPNITECIHS